MELINISESVVQDLKEVLRQQNIEGNTLRIDANAG